MAVFWKHENLAHPGVEFHFRFSADELKKAGINPEKLSKEDWSDKTTLEQIQKVKTIAEKV